MPWGLTVNTPGEYADTIRTISGCDSIISRVEVRLSAGPILSITKSNDVNCIRPYANLNVSGAGNYHWSPASGLNDPLANNPIATPTITTTYYVTGTDANGCIGIDSIEVKVNTDDPENGYIVPSAFSPNDDGLNDCFGVRYWGPVTNFRFSVYNRWGNLVFYTLNPQRCWDGIYKGKKQPVGNYVYIVTAKGLCGPVFRKGNVVLIR